MSETTVSNEHDLNVTFYESGYPNQLFLKSKIPYWYAQAPADLHVALYASQMKSHFSQCSLKQLVAPLKSIHDFAWPLLNQKLLEQFNIHLDCRHMALGNIASGVNDVAPALVSALQNFPAQPVFKTGTALYFQEAAYPPGIDGLGKLSLTAVCDDQRIDCNSARIDIQPAAFAEVCRGLDLGGQYQLHLDSVFKPPATAEQSASVRQQSVTAAFVLKARHRFEVLSHLALMKKHIGADAYLALLELARINGNPVWGGGPVKCSALHLLSRSPFKDGLLRGAMLIESHGTGSAHQDSGPLVVYLPGDPNHPLREYATLKAFHDDLRGKLDDDVYLKHFARFVGLRHRSAFLSSMQATLRPRGPDGAPDPRIDLQLQRPALGKPAFEALHEQTVDKLYDNARLLAVPAHDSSDATRVAGYELLKKFGHELYELVDHFLPVSEVRDIAADAFFAVDSWNDGERLEALGYLFDLAKNVALIALPKSALKKLEALEKIYDDGKKAVELIKEVLEATGLTGKDKRTGQQALEAEVEDDDENPYALVEIAELQPDGSEWVERTTPPSQFVESLVQVTSTSGEVRLWKPTLAPLEQALLPPKGTQLDPRSLFYMGGRTLLAMDRCCYAVAFDTVRKEWRVENPGGQLAYAPLLQTNSVGAWRHEGENPMGWDAVTAFRRLHGDFAGLSDTAIRRILQITEVDEAVLRRVHVDNLAPPALLVDCAQRFRINDQLDDFITLMDNKGTGSLINQILGGELPEGAEAPALQDAFVIADIRPYLDFIVTLPGWPAQCSLLHVDSLGQNLSRHGPSGAGVRSIPVSYTPGNINALLDMLLRGLSPLEVQLLLINYRGPRSHREYLAFRIASEAKGRRAELFNQVYGYRNRSLDDATRTLTRDFRSLPDIAAAEIIASATLPELDFLTTSNRVPLRLAESAREYQQQLRVNRALECFFFRQMFVPDTSTVTLSLVDNLPAWPSGLVVDVRDQSFAGPQIVRLGDRTASEASIVLVHAPLGYQTFDRLGKRLDHQNHSLLGALLALLPAEARAQTGLPDKPSLSSALGDIAIAKRDKVKEVMGLQKIKPGIIWPLRLPDGRVGYPLSGRLRSLFGKLKAGAPVFSPELAVQNLYPQFNAGQIKDFLANLVEGFAGGPHARRNFVRGRLHELAAEYRQLENTLDQWKAELLYPDAGTVPSATLGGREVARVRLLSCWRREGLVAVGQAPQNRVHRLDLSGLPIGGLPLIRANFDHVGELLLDNLQLTSFAVEGFIGRFSRLSRLSLRGNRLENVPVALGNCHALEKLVLSNNPLVLDRVSLTRLEHLDRLQTLELEGPGIDLQVTPELRYWPALVELKLRNAGLTDMPLGIGARETLRHVDLRHNQISEISEDALHLIASRPQLYVRLHYNPLSEQTITAATRILDNTALLRMGIADVLPQQADWLSASGEHEQLLCLESLRNVPSGNDFFQLLDELNLSAEYRNNRLILTQRIWRMIEAMCSSDSLREDLFGLAAHPTTCGDGAMLVFNNLDVRVLLFNLQASGQSVEPEAMFKLMRGLERLDELEHIALEDYNARVIANPSLDLAEVRLVYPTRLRDELQLPGQAMSMLFELISGVSQDMLDRARDRVIAREGTPQFFQALIAREAWMNFLQEHYRSRFTSLTEPFHERLEALDKTREAQYLLEVSTLVDERRDAVNELALQLTREIAQTAAPGR